jgi:hypothetical protein
MMRLPEKIRHELKRAAAEAFGEAELVLFGSRLDDREWGSDLCGVDKHRFRESKIKFFKILLLKDLDLPIDLVHHEEAGSLLKREIDKGRSI